MRGIVLAEQGHFVNIMPAVDITGGKASVPFSMKNFRKASIFLSVGVSAAAWTKILVEAVDNPAGANPVALPFSLYAEETDAGDTLSGRVAVTSAGYTPSANNNIMYVIEIDAMDLPDDKTFIRLNLTNGANSVIASAVAILNGARFGGAANGVTALA